ncbi:hypothetical protein HMPREF9134_01066 [Porphyromonas catoniae F0037]|uniref:Uncharacterized protein n=1 Tax=Porphyromonas catoniae F0037 TaxID=1127696 RepID=L1NCZ9_9PORP|nr:hypothetical protein HMPREF9134_01066 [Porphyromonas catoniae F0037]
MAELANSLVNPPCFSRENLAKDNSLQSEEYKDLIRDAQEGICSCVSVLNLHKMGF